ncbi:MAG: hypothetical protein ACK4TL_16210 [Hyphomicrobiaceae bacterium]
MNIGQLKNVLRVAAQQYREAGDADTARALSDLATNLLKDKDSETVAAFVKRVEKARNPPAPKLKAARKRK